MRQSWLLAFLQVMMAFMLFGFLMKQGREANFKSHGVIPLGIVRVTQYSHFEKGGRLTASGYLLTDLDDGKVCAVGRDWFRSFVKVGDSVKIDGFPTSCLVLDTMAIRNSKGLMQTKWVDVYTNDPVSGLDFGIQHREAFLIRRESYGNF